MLLLVKQLMISSNKYPEVSTKIKSEALNRYKIILKGPVMKQKETEIEEIKNRSEDEVLLDPEIENQNQDNLINEQDLRKENSDDLYDVLKKKIDGIQDEMGKFAKNISEYIKSCDREVATIAHYKSRELI
jgi:hypothetical protein